MHVAGRDRAVLQYLSNNKGEKYHLCLKLAGSLHQLALVELAWSLQRPP